MMRSAAARGEVADLASARYGASALRAGDWSMVVVLLVLRDGEIATCFHEKRQQCLKAVRPRQKLA